MSKVLNEEAGPSLRMACASLTPLDMGQVIITEGFNLPAKCKRNQKKSNRSEPINKLLFWLYLTIFFRYYPHQRPSRDGTWVGNKFATLLPEISPIADWQRTTHDCGFNNYLFFLILNLLPKHFRSFLVYQPEVNLQTHPSLLELVSTRFVIFCKGIEIR